MGRNCPSADTITSTSKTHVFTATTSGGYLYRAVSRFQVLWWIPLTQSRFQAALGLCRRIRQWYVSSADTILSLRTDPDVHYIVFYFYECCIAFTEEVSVIWRRKWTGMTWLFASTRYIVLFLQILSFMPNPTYIVSPLSYCSV